MGAAAARSADTYGAESLVPHQCRHGRDHPDTRTAPGAVDRRTPIASMATSATAVSLVRRHRGGTRSPMYWLDARHRLSAQVAPHIPRERYEQSAGLLRSVAVISMNCSASSLHPGSVRSVSGTEQAELVSYIRKAAAACNMTPIVVCLRRLSGPPTHPDGPTRAGRARAIFRAGAVVAATEPEIVESGSSLT